jgi:hypothetical protein
MNSTALITITLKKYMMNNKYLIMTVKEPKLKI